MGNELDWMKKLDWELTTPNQRNKSNPTSHVVNRRHRNNRQIPSQLYFDKLMWFVVGIIATLTFLNPQFYVAVGDYN